MNKNQRGFEKLGVRIPCKEKLNKLSGNCGQILSVVNYEDVYVY